MAAETKTRVTFEDYAGTPETNQIIELIDGEIIASPPLDKHQRVLIQVVWTVHPFMKQGHPCLVPSGLHFDQSNSFEPDLFWISPENTQCFLEDNGRYWHGAPDLVIEVLSPSTASNDRGIKFETYQKYGVREYWLVDPDAQFTEVYRYAEGKFERHSVFKPNQPFISVVLGGATIDTQAWFRE
jgi:Uma2 family endonuclease